MPVPRFGEAPRRGIPAASAEEVKRLMRRAGIVAALLVAWALAGAIAALASSRIDGVGLALVGILPAAVAVAAFVLDRRAPSRAKSGVAAAAGTLALAFALAGHVLFWGGANLSLFLLVAPPALRWSVFAAVLLLVPLYAGARLRALHLAWSVTGSRARGPWLTLEAIARREDLLGPAPWGAAWRGAIARWAEGARLPGLLLLDAATSAARPADRIAAEGPLDAIAEALAAQGASVETRGRDLLVKTGEGEPLRVAPARLLIPEGPALDVAGDVAAARRLRRLLEGPAAHALVFTRSRSARRWERRVNALQREALVAGSLEERSLVMEELDRIRKALSHRRLAGEEFTILSLKEESARAALAHRMLSEPPGVRSTGALAQHGALVPRLARVVDAGGLAAVKRVAFVPFWIVPVTTPWGEQEVALNAATGRLDTAESAALLDAMQGQRGPSLFLDVGPQAVFLPAPPPTAALLREVRAAGLRANDDVASAADVVYVPYLATPEGYVSGITGAPAPDLGNVVPVAPAH